MGIIIHKKRQLFLAIAISVAFVVECGAEYERMVAPASLLLDLSGNRNAIKDLRLTAEQTAQIRELHRDYLARYREFQSLIEPPLKMEFESVEDRREYFGQRKQFLKLLSEWRAEHKPVFWESLLRLLNPNQLERLKQLTLQRRYLDDGLIAVLKSTDVTEKIAELNISDEQMAELEEAIEKANAKFKEQKDALGTTHSNDLRLIEQIRFETMFEPLSKEQRKKFFELLGDPIHTSDSIQNMIDNRPRRKRRTLPSISNMVPTRLK